MKMKENEFIKFEISNFTVTESFDFLFLRATFEHILKLYL